jgi:hypothetical protein
MAKRHFYLGIENLALNSAQRATLVNELKALGPASDPQPCRLNHWRTRPDNNAVIFEAHFDVSNLTTDRFKQRLAAIFGVDEGDISHSVQNPSYADTTTVVVTFTYGGTDYLRFATYGGVDASWGQSKREVLGYLFQNLAIWEAE